MRKIGCAAMLCMCLLLAAFAGAAEEKADMAHYLLVGVDGWGLNEAGGARSDAIILTSLDYGRERITFTSIARDSIVKPSYRKTPVKLNTLVRSEGGEQMLTAYIEEAFGIPISGYFVINFSGAVDVINAVGGIDVTLTQEEAEYLRYHAGEYAGYPLHAGPCRLNGGQALYYMRCRSLDNDFGRQGRQGNVLRAVMDELRNITPLRVILLLDDVLGMYRTDLSSGQQLELALKALSLKDAQVQIRALPAEGAYRYGQDSHGTSGLIFNLEANRAQLYRWLGLEEPAMQTVGQGE